ncbi:MAG: HD domain-containing protein [Vicinamibacterales bacterium]|nr:HD domain-containing protein [Vicinamibacterales bacterium]
MAGVPAAGIAVLLWAVVDLVVAPPPPEWLALAALTVLTGSFTVKIPGLVARLSVSEPFVFAATLLFGPAAGAITAALDALIMSLWLLPGLKTLHRLLFNVSVLVVSIWVSSQMFFVLAGLDPRAPVYPSLGAFIAPLYVFTLCCFLLNSGLVAVALSYERQQPALEIWRSQFLWLSVNYFSGASVAALIVVYAKTIDFAVIGIVLPLLAISYLTFRTTLGRLEDTNRHLVQVNKLYLSTIETLAMAVDAKDQVTHGHIRRVQQYAMGLAGELGVVDRKQLQAIEAAALLHDMGKLAIPEYILNKPGKLSPSEFEKMKLHASIGADILSAIEFPYPVVPIVRHHHESWNGGGYPDGISGTQIPIGARILSVVDCFDALTSDRPYRPALSTESAIKIILERRGGMYDPLIVDTFISALPRLTASLAVIEPSPETIQAIARLNAPRVEPVEAATGNDGLAHADVLPLFSLLESLPRGFDPNALALLLLSRVSRFAPLDGCVVFLVGPSNADVVAAGVAGAVPLSFCGTVIPFGGRIAGWAAATRSAVRNSDPVLDFGPLVGSFASAMAIPLHNSDTVVGVLTFYSNSDTAYSADHQRFAELLAAQVAELYGSKQTDSREVPAEPPTPDQWPGWLELDRVLAFDHNSISKWSPLSLISIDADGVSPLICSAVGDHARQAVRLGDLAFRLADTEFLLLLPKSSPETAAAVSDRLRASITAVSHASTVRVVATTCAGDELLVTALRRVREHRAQRPGSGRHGHAVH